MDDLISRQAAIDEIDEWIKAFRENVHKESAADARFIRDGIIQLPSAQRWVPCIERLPETSGTYIATADMYGVTLGEEWHMGSIVCALFYNARTKKWSSEEENTWVDDVIAWQPLPECYRGEE